MIYSRIITRWNDDFFFGVECHVGTLLCQRLANIEEYSVVGDLLRFLAVDLESKALFTFICIIKALVLPTY
jgi:hypothetical protein